MKARGNIASFDEEGVDEGRVYAVLKRGFRFVRYRSHGKSFDGKQQARAAEIEPCACIECTKEAA